VIRKINKGCIIIFIILWIFNCASDEIDWDEGLPQKEKSTKEVDLKPRPTRLKK
jgi:hypothetical protein